MSEIRFPYKPKIYLLIPSIIILLICAFGFCNAAITNEKELVITLFKKILFTLSVEKANIFYWSICLFFVFFAIYATKAIYLSITTKREIILTEYEIIAPKNGISRDVVSVRFNEIENFKIKSIQQQRFLNILYQGGKLTIPQSMLPNKQAFEELISLVSSRANG